LGLDKLTVGQKPSYGKYLVKNKNGFLSGEAGAIDNGSFELPVSFSGNFAITGEYSFKGSEEIKLSSDGYEVKLVSYGVGFHVHINGAYAKDSNNSTASAGGYASNAPNKFKLTVINNELKTFDGVDTLLSTVTLKPNLTYTKLAVSGIRETSELVSLSVLGDTATVSSTGGTTPVTCPTPTGGTTNGTPVTLGANLNMKLPNVSYQTLGGTMNLWAELQYQPTNDGKFWWTLSNYGVNP